MPHTHVHTHSLAHRIYWTPSKGREVRQCFFFSPPPPIFFSVTFLKSLMVAACFSFRFLFSPSSSHFPHLLSNTGQRCKTVKLRSLNKRAHLMSVEHFSVSLCVCAETQSHTNNLTFLPLPCWAVCHGREVRHHVILQWCVQSRMHSAQGPSALDDNQLSLGHRFSTA